MGALFGDYALGAAWDEMFAADGRARPPYDGVQSALETARAQPICGSAPTS